MNEVDDEKRVFEIRANFLQSIFGTGIKSPDHFAVSCPSCCSETDRKHKKKLSIRLASGMHHCWICGLKGKTLKYTIKKYKPQYLSEYCRIFEEEDYNSKIKPSVEDEEIIAVLPTGFIPLATSIPLDPDHIATIKYLFARQISKGDFYRYRLGTCTTGKFSRKVIMPSFDANGDLNYFTARSIDSNGSKKYINSKVKRKDVIFNEINIRWDKPLTLVEGPFDLMKCNWNATAILGSYLDESYQLFQKIVKNCTEVILAMDSDAKDKRSKIAQKLKSYGINVKYINLDKFNDVGEMTKLEFEEILQNAKTWSSVSLLNSKISNIRSSSNFF
jgi:hypothetical protein